MRRSFPSKEIEEEDRRLGELICNSDEELTIEEMIEKYASAHYKAYLIESEKREKMLWEKYGVIEE